MIDNDGNFDLADFSDVNGCWMCDANQGIPVVGDLESGLVRPTSCCDGSGVRIRTGPPRFTPDGAIGGGLRVDVF
jgi:hypothetical protein